MVSAVSAKPNATRVRGRIISVDSLPEKRGYVWKVAIDEASTIGDQPGFALQRVGQEIDIYAPPTAPALGDDDKIEATVTYVGDERGGDFLLYQNDVSML